MLNHDRASSAIAGLKADLAGRGEATSLFGQSAVALPAILGNIEQTMFGEPLYASRELKAAHLLYFIIKNHPFTDGNKRIASLLFLLFRRSVMALLIRKASRSGHADRYPSPPQYGAFS